MNLEYFKQVLVSLAGLINSQNRMNYLFKECPVELDNVFTITALLDNIQVHQQLMLLLLIYRGTNSLTKAKKETNRNHALYGGL